MRFIHAESLRLPEDGDDWAPALVRAMAAGETQISLPRGTLVFRSGVDVTEGVIIAGSGVRHTVCQFIGTAYGFRFRSGAVGVRGPYARLWMLTVTASAPLVDADGIRIEAGKSALWDVIVTGWSRDGVAILGSAPNNANHGTHLLVGAGGNGRHGVSMVGADGQCHALIGCDSRDNGGGGFVDGSFLGNYLFGCHASHNGGLDYDLSGDSQIGAVVGCYSETRLDPQGAPIPTVKVARGNAALQLRGTRDATPGAYLGAKAGSVSLSEVVGGSAAGSSARLGSSDPETALSFGDTTGKGYRLLKKAAGGLSHLWAYAWQGSTSAAAIAMTTDGHARGAGIAALPRGALLGLGASQRMVSTSAAAPVSPGTIGDVVLAATPTATLDGWRYVTGPEGPYWRAFAWGAGS